MTKPRVIRINNKSGSSFTLDVTQLRLSDNLSERDFYVLHNGEDKTNLYTKTSQTTLTYNGPNVASGTVIQTARQTIVQPADVTFLSVSTAADLTLALTKLKKAAEEIEAHTNFVIDQLNASNISLRPSPVINEDYGSSWDGDILSAPSRNSVYRRINQLLTGPNTLTGSYDITGGSVLVSTQPNANSSTNAASTAFVNNKITELKAANNTFTGSNTFSGSLSVPTQSNSSNSTDAASTAYVNNKLNELKAANNTFSGSNTFTGSSTFNGSVSVPTVSNARDSSTNAASTAFVQNAIFSTTWVVATCNNNPSLAINSWTDLPLNTTLLNRGSSYNTSSFIWTCPETGVWKFSVYFCPFATGGTLPTQTESAIVLTDTSNNFIQQIAGNTETKAYGRSIGSISISLSANTQYKIRYLVGPTGGSGFTYNIKQAPELSPNLTIERIG
jgi:hypothetical protein